MNPSSLRKSLKLCCPDLKEIVNGGEVDECNRVSQQNVQRKQQDCERANLDHCEIDDSEVWSKELFSILQVVKEMVEVDQIISQRQNC